MSKISPCLWFDGQAEEAAQLYTSLVPDSRIESDCGHSCLDPDDNERRLGSSIKKPAKILTHLGLSARALIQRPRAEATAGRALLGIVKQQA